MRESAAVILMDPGGRVLLRRRVDDELWRVPSGTVDEGEEPREAALRAFESETGVRLERMRFFRSVADGGAATTRQQVFFADDVVEAGAMEAGEGASFAFFSPDDVRGLVMHEADRALLEEFFGHDKYRGTLMTKAAYKTAAALLVLDPWGRVLLQLRDSDLPPERFPDHWSLPGGIIEAGEAPDRAALREFEEETGCLLDDLKLFRVFKRATNLPILPVDVEHVYYADPAIAEDEIEVNEGQAFRYFLEAELADLLVPAHARAVLAHFFESPAYKGLFH